jgi:AraC family transcriptional regulator, positive regulator of tynA and feaB
MGAYGATVVDADPVGFQGVLTNLSADQLQISSVQSTPAVCRSAVGRKRSRGDETTFSLQVVHRGRCRIDHAGIGSIGVTGDMFIADSSRSYELAFVEPVEGLVLSPPWSRFRAHADKLEELAGHRINVANGPGAVLSSFIRSAWDELVDCDPQTWPQSATDVIWDLFESVLQGQGMREPVTGQPALLRRNARVLVDDNFRDCAFKSSAIAEALGVSPRYLQMVFAEVGTTPSRFLVARRLEAAAARLRHLERPLRVTDIALECGFNDLSYFSRAFRRRFGTSARAYRLRFAANAGDWL